MKLNNISLLRLVSTVSIFAFHVLIGVLSFAGGARRVFPLFFAVQIFLFISGYLYANKTITDVKNFYLKNFIKIFIPTLIYLGFYVIMALIRWNVWTGNNFTAIYRDISFSLGHLWFVPIIMLCYLLLPVMQMAMTKGHKHQKLCIFMVILVGVGEIFNVCFLGLQVSFVPFFVGGILGKTRSQDFNSPTPPPDEK